MLSFKQLLSEGSKSIDPEEPRQIAKLFKYTEKLGTANLINRGYKKLKGEGANISTVAMYLEFVANTKGRKLRGTNSNSVIDKKNTVMLDVISGLNLSYDPVFTSGSSAGSFIFGQGMVFIPAGAFTAYYHPKIDDLVSSNPFIKTDTSADEIIKGYKSVKNSIPSFRSEIIFDCKGYYLADVRHIMSRMLRSKFKTFDDERKLKTYADLTIFLKEYHKLLVWAVEKNNRRFVAPNPISLSKRDAKERVAVLLGK